MIEVLEEIARVITATSRGVAGSWAGSAGKRVMFWRFRDGDSELGEGPGLTFPGSILARFVFCSFRGEDRESRLVAYLQ